jgi:hypothetical protein
MAFAPLEGTPFAMIVWVGAVGGVAPGVGVCVTKSGVSVRNGPDGCGGCDWLCGVEIAAPSVAVGTTTAVCDGDVVTGSVPAATSPAWLKLSRRT